MSVFRHAHFRTGMLTAAAPTGAGGTCAAITDGGDRAGNSRHASIRLVGDRVVKPAT